MRKTLLDAYHRCLLVGGMPECVDAWCRNRDLQEVERIQNELLAFYEGDFGKHLEGIDATRVLLTFRSVIPQLAKQNEKFLYGAIKEGARAREFETSVEWCVQAGLFNRLYNKELPSEGGSHVRPLVFCATAEGAFCD